MLAAWTAALLVALLAKRLVESWVGHLVVVTAVALVVPLVATLGNNWVV